MSRSPHVRINVKVTRYISILLSPVALHFILVQLNTAFQQNYARPHVVCFQTFIGTEKFSYCTGLPVLQMSHQFTSLVNGELATGSSTCVSQYCGWIVTSS